MSRLGRIWAYRSKMSCEGVGADLNFREVSFKFTKFLRFKKV